ncbi:MAG: hypothetical protein ACOYEF_02950 [Planifilum sp.]|jgi:hypothetical protein
MIHINIGTVNIENVSQAGSVNFGSTLNAVEPPPGRDRRDRSEGISLDQRRKPDEKRMSAGRRKGRRREPFCPPSLPPGGLLPLVPVPGWTPLPYLYG